MQITYQKRDGSVIQRLRETPLHYKIGDRTSMGWKVLNIEFELDGKYYPEYKYNMLIYKNRQTRLKKKQTKVLFAKEFKVFLYCFISTVIIYFLKALIGA